MATETTTIDICDRCGSRHNRSEYMFGGSWGQMRLKWNGDKGSRAYDGAAAGMTFEGSAWLCLACTDAFLSFMKPGASA